MRERTQELIRKQNSSRIEESRAEIKFKQKISEGGGHHMRNLTQFTHTLKHWLGTSPSFNNSINNLIRANLLSNFKARDTLIKIIEDLKKEASIRYYTINLDDPDALLQFKQILNTEDRILVKGLEGVGKSHLIFQALNEYIRRGGHGYIYLTHTRVNLEDKIEMIEKLNPPTKPIYLLSGAHVCLNYIKKAIEDHSVLIAKDQNTKELFITLGYLNGNFADHVYNAAHLIGVLHVYRGASVYEKEKDLIAELREYVPEAAPKTLSKAIDALRKKANLQEYAEICQKHGFDDYTFVDYNKIKKPAHLFLLDVNAFRSSFNSSTYARYIDVSSMFYTLFARHLKTKKTKVCTTLFMYIGKHFQKVKEKLEELVNDELIVQILSELAGRDLKPAHNRTQRSTPPDYAIFSERQFVNKLAEYLEAKLIDILDDGEILILTLLNHDDLEELHEDILRAKQFTTKMDALPLPFIILSTSQNFIDKILLKESKSLYKLFDGILFIDELMDLDIEIAHEIVQTINAARKKFFSMSKTFYNKFGKILIERMVYHICKDNYTGAITFGLQRAIEELLEANKEAKEMFKEMKKSFGEHFRRVSDKLKKIMLPRSHYEKLLVKLISYLLITQPEIDSLIALINKLIQEWKEWYAYYVRRKKEPSNEKEFNRLNILILLRILNVPTELIERFRWYLKDDEQTVNNIFEILTSYIFSNALHQALSIYSDPQKELKRRIKEEQDLSIADDAIELLREHEFLKLNDLLEILTTKFNKVIIATTEPSWILTYMAKGYTVVEFTRSSAPQGTNIFIITHEDNKVYRSSGMESRIKEMEALTHMLLALNNGRLNLEFPVKYLKKFNKLTWQSFVISSGHYIERLLNSLHEFNRFHLRDHFHAERELFLYLKEKLELLKKEDVVRLFKTHNSSYSVSITPSEHNLQVRNLYNAKCYFIDGGNRAPIQYSITFNSQNTMPPIASFENVLSIKDQFPEILAKYIQIALDHIYDEILKQRKDEVEIQRSPILQELSKLIIKRTLESIKKISQLAHSEEDVKNLRDLIRFSARIAYSELITQLQNPIIKRLIALADSMAKKDLDTIKEHYRALTKMLYSKYEHLPVINWENLLQELDRNLYDLDEILNERQGKLYPLLATALFALEELSFEQMQKLKATLQISTEANLHTIIENITNRYAMPLLSSIRINYGDESLMLSLKIHALLRNLLGDAMYPTWVFSRRVTYASLKGLNIDHRPKVAHFWYNPYSISLINRELYRRFGNIADTTYFTIDPKGTLSQGVFENREFILKALALFESIDNLNQGLGRWHGHRERGTTFSFIHISRNYFQLVKPLIRLSSHYVQNAIEISYEELKEIILYTIYNKLPKDQLDKALEVISKELKTLHDLLRRDPVAFNTLINTSPKELSLEERYALEKLYLQADSITKRVKEKLNKQLEQFVKELEHLMDRPLKEIIKSWPKARSQTQRALIEYLKGIYNNRTASKKLHEVLKLSEEDVPTFIENVLKGYQHFIEEISLTIKALAMLYLAGPEQIPDLLNTLRQAYKSAFEALAGRWLLPYRKGEDVKDLTNFIIDLLNIPFKDLATDSVRYYLPLHESMRLEDLDELNDIDHLERLTEKISYIPASHRPLIKKIIDEVLALLTPLVKTDLLNEENTPIVYDEQYKLALSLYLTLKAAFADKLDVLEDPKEKAKVLLKNAALIVLNYLADLPLQAIQMLSDDIPRLIELIEIRVLTLNSPYPLTTNHLMTYLLIELLKLIKQEIAWRGAVTRHDRQSYLAHSITNFLWLFLSDYIHENKVYFKNSDPFLQSLSNQPYNEILTVDEILKNIQIDYKPFYMKLLRSSRHLNATLKYLIQRELQQGNPHADQIMLKTKIKVDLARTALDTYERFINNLPPHIQRILLSEQSSAIMLNRSEIIQRLQQIAIKLPLNIKESLESYLNTPLLYEILGLQKQLAFLFLKYDLIPDEDRIIQTTWQLLLDTKHHKLLGKTREIYKDLHNFSLKAFTDRLHERLQQLTSQQTLDGLLNRLHRLFYQDRSVLASAR